MYQKNKIVFDIETVGVEFETLDETSQEYLKTWFERFAQTQEEIEEQKDQLSFSPLLAQIVAIAMLNPDTQKGLVYFQAPGKEVPPYEKEGVRYEVTSEKEMLERFWKDVEKYDAVVTFNGRQFDAPFVMLRSAIHGIRPTRNLIPYRYDVNSHIDLFDQLTFYGALRRKMNLHFWTKAFGIASPKEGEVSGKDVKKMFLAQEYEKIAHYCMADVIATAELYRRWDTYLNGLSDRA